MWFEYLPCWLVGHRYGHINDDGIQYCGRCGVARAAPCPHKWVLHEGFKSGCDDEKGTFLAVLYVLRCEKCGDMMRRRMDSKLKEGR